MPTRESKRRFFYPTPGWLVILSLAVTGILFLSERFQCFGFNTHKGWTVLIAVASVGVVLALMLLWLIIALVFRLRFQFSIRSLLVLVIAVALPFSWLGVEMKKAREQRVAVQRFVELEPNYNFVGEQGCLVNGESWAKVQPPPPNWLVDLVGADFFADVFEGYLGRTKVTDKDMEHFEGLPQVTLLVLDDTAITDDGLQHIRGLKQLRTLSLEATNVTDIGLKHLRGLNQLNDLSLSRTSVTDAGLENLKGLQRLASVGLYGTQVTDEGVKAALPNCLGRH